MLGAIVTGDGNDSYTGFVGTLQGTAGHILLGGGNDTVIGGSAAETVQDGDGSDKISLDGGNDTYIDRGLTNDGIDTIDGGAGTDIYHGAYGLIINIDTVGHNENYGNHSAEALVAPGLAMDNDGVTTRVDKISGFENVGGGILSDLIYGSSGANYLFGSIGDDDIWGYAGNDTIDGSIGSDFLVGGLGADILTGGDEADRFMYLSTTDSAALP